LPGRLKLLLPFSGSFEQVLVLFRGLELGFRLLELLLEGLKLSLELLKFICMLSSNNTRVQ